MSALFTLMQHHRPETVRCGQFNCVSCECGERFDGHDPHRQHIADLIEAKWELKPRTRMCGGCTGTGKWTDTDIGGFSTTQSCDWCGGTGLAAAGTNPIGDDPT